MTTPLLRLAILLLFAGCAARAPLPSPPTGITTVTVAAVENATGSTLIVSGDSYVARWVGIKKRTVADVLRDELAAALRERGFTVADAGAVPTLKVKLVRFEPDQPQLTSVDAGVVATLTSHDGQEAWRMDEPHRLVSTAGSPSLAAAYQTAARVLARAIVDGWTPAP